MNAPRKKWLIPEVLQTSLMDCGPAALKALLEGFGLEVDYDALRARCATDVDGTSLSALCRLGGELGLESYEMLVPRDNFSLPEARCLPAIAVTRAASGELHFIVVWNRLGPFLQVFDPGSGRRWLRRSSLLELIPNIPVVLSQDKWRRWVASPDGLAPLRVRLSQLGISGAAARALLALADRDPSWLGFATLDAGARMLAVWVAAGAVRKGREAARLLDAVVSRAAAGASASADAFEIPDGFYWVTDTGAPPGKLVARGSVIVHFAGLRAAPTLTLSAEPPASAGRELASKQPQPLRALLRLVRLDSGWRLGVLIGALLGGALLVPLEGLLLRALLDVERSLGLDYQRAAGLGLLVLFLLAGLWLELWSGSAVRRVGRRLELRLRAAFLEQLPRLSDHYLQSRPSSDMAARAHSLHLLREVPALWAQAARAGFGLLATCAALAWLYPQGLAWTLGLALVSLIVPLLARRPLLELALRLRVHQASLGRFHLDALLGVSPIRAHAAERSVAREHERLLTEWARTVRAFHARASALLGLQMVASTALALGVVCSYLANQADVSRLLLLAYWALGVPTQATQVVNATLALRSLRGAVLRLMAPLSAPSMVLDDTPRALPPAARGVALALEQATVRAGGHILLSATELQIAPGSHVAIVGASGAGKSSLLGLFLGWLSPSTGRVTVDGELLDAVKLARLREETAWVDPAVRLWDQSLYDNLVFGDDEEPQRSLGTALAHSDLLELLEHLPEGLQASLGEGGVRLSGGQGQRVRLGRGLMRRQARLVLLDEPFRGLERERRSELLGRARQHWHDATLLFVSHDVQDTLGFDRVLVMSGGRIVEDGAPARLAADPNSHYAQLNRAAQELRAEFRSATRWRRHVLEKGRLGAVEAP
jgi:ABC-type bacteriocin/lantibiotic exporter with double-glycine peptidase domain